MQLTKRFNRRRTRCRRGVAVAELAVCLPVIVLVVFATIEACTMLFLQQSLSIAAYEGARVSLVPQATEVNVRQQCEQILDDREVAGYTVQVTPQNFESTPEGTWIQVQASAPFSDNSMIGGYLFAGRTLTANVEMMKER